MDLQDIDFVYFQTRSSLCSSDSSKKVHILLTPSSFEQFSYVLYQRDANFRQPRYEYFRNSKVINSNENLIPNAVNLP